MKFWRRQRVTKKRILSLILFVITGTATFLMLPFIYSDVDARGFSFKGRFNSYHFVAARVAMRYKYRSLHKEEETQGSVSEPTPLPTIEPTLEPSETPTPTETPVETATPIPTIEPTQTTTPTPSPTVEPTVEPTIEPTDSPTPTPSATIAPTPTPVVTMTPNPAPTPTATPRPTLPPTQTPTPTPSPTVEPTVEPTATPTESPTPTATPIEFIMGVVAQDFMNVNGEIPSIETKIGTSIETISIFKQFGLDGNKDIDLSHLAFAKSRGMKVQVAWEPWNPEQGIGQSVDYLTAIPKGQYDSYLRSFAADLKAYGGQVNLRFGHEMNGGWYPWGQRPDEYIKAYRYIYSFFKAEGATNVAFMWCPNITLTDDISDLAPYYPGDEYVDVIGIDGFNFGSSQDSGGWRTFSDLFGSTYEFLTSHYEKPIIIAETASAEVGGDKAAWIKQMFADLPTKFPAVHEIIWFNLLKETDWRIDSTTSSANAFKVSIPLLISS